jgi:hypothetical protein
MLWRSSLLLALMLAVGPRPGVAEGVFGSSMATPIRPSPQGFVSLFQSLTPRVMRDPVSPAPLTPAAVAVTPRVGQPTSAGTIASGAMCRPALIAAEARHGIPPGVLQAIGIVESGRRDEATGERQPWPWTINAEGEPHIFDTKEQAVAWVRQARARGIRSIDTGCAQVNLMHHPTAFASLEEAFDPAANADYAARFLKELRDTTAGGNWMTAVGYYHSQTPELAEPYRQQVQAAMARSTAPMPTPVAVATAFPSSLSSPAGPGRSPATAQPELAARSGTVGRGLDAYRAAPIQIAAVIRPLLNAAQR